MARYGQFPCYLMTDRAAKTALVFGSCPREPQYSFQRGVDANEADHQQAKKTTLSHKWRKL